MQRTGSDELAHLAVTVPVRHDRRGAFVKVLGDDIRNRVGGQFDVAEIFWTRSDRNVVRGLHFQTPPASVAKLVWCSDGQALDVVLDLRASSPTYGCWAGFVITPDNGMVVHVPHGFAHGFCALAPDTVIGYAQSGSFDPLCDAGVRWDSAGIDWPIEGESVVSDRDQSLPPFATFATPF